MSSKKLAKLILAWKIGRENFLENLHKEKLEADPSSSTACHLRVLSRSTDYREIFSWRVCFRFGFFLLFGIIWLTADVNLEQQFVVFTLVVTIVVFEWQIIVSKITFEPASIVFMRIIIQTSASDANIFNLRVYFHLLNLHFLSTKLELT